MENFLLLGASTIAALCAVISFFTSNSTQMKKTLISLWLLSTSLVACASGLMVNFLIQLRLEYEYVYSHSSTSTELIYRISSLWSGQEGSFLLWALALGIMGFALLFSNDKWLKSAFSIYALISSCIFLMSFILWPFSKTSVIPTDGLGLNQALKDPWMVIHPPLVFISYSAMAVLFSLSATLSKAPAKESSMRICLWLRISWFFLGIGILSGSIWAYRALGWGGYWAWDPIENAAFVPWLVMCAFLHREDFKSMPVCIMPFSIACFGVFLARSGVLNGQSIHAYAEGSGIVIAIILMIIIGSLLFLSVSILRKPRKKRVNVVFSIYDKPIILYSIYVYAMLIFLGTVAPIILKVKTPVSFYASISLIFTFIYISLLLLWDLECLKKRYIFVISLSTFIMAGIITLTRSNKLLWLILIWFCLMPVSLWIISGFRTKSLRYYLSHLGFVLMITGSISSTALSSESFILGNSESSKFVVSGIDIPRESLEEKDMIIKSLPLKDIVIHSSKILPLLQGGLLIPYVTKPLIILFWLGSVMVIVQPILYLILNRAVHRLKSNNSK